MQKTQPYYPCVDILKYVMALAVVAIHHSSICKINLPFLSEWFVRQAVPFFFIVSGFFLASKLNNSEPDEKRNILRHRAVKIFTTYILWLIIYLPLSIYYYIAVSPDSLTLVILKYFKAVIFSGESPYSWPLWFIYSLAIVCFLYSLVLKSKPLMTVLLILCLLSYLVNYCLYFEIDVPCSGVERILDYLIKRPLGGGIYIFLGFYMFRYSHQLRRLSVALIPIALFVSIMLFYTRMPFWELFGGLGFVLAGLCARIQMRPVYSGLRAQSLWIYFFHMYVLVFIYVLFKDFSLSHPGLYMLCVYIAVCTVAYALYRLQRHIPFLKKLIV